MKHESGLGCVASAFLAVLIVMAYVFLGPVFAGWDIVP